MRELQNVDPLFNSQDYELVIEEPCYAIDSDSYD